MGKPEIRFKGYTDEWEQRKLGDVLDDMYNGQTPSRNKSEYWNGNIKWLSSGELNRGTVHDSIEMITEDGQKSANLRIVPKGTFIMAITGLEAAGTRGNCALLGFDTTLNQSCMALFPKKDLLTSDFLFQWYRKVGEEYGLNYTQGTKQQSYNAELIKILPISLPSVTEQKKIASYLSNLDYLITLHQRKCDEVKSLKKYMLQKMFPQNEQKVPEIRFEGFTEAWEQRKLGELTEIGDIDHRMPASVDDGIPYLMTGDFVGENELNFDDVKNISEEDYNLLSRKIRPEQGDILFARYASVGAVRYVDFSRKFLISYSCAIIKQSNKINSRYLYHYLTSEGTQNQIKLETKTGSQANIGIDSMKKYINISVPCNEEQEKIGQYFANLDSLITLHQQKCEELKKIKKFMLQRMFV